MTSKNRIDVHQHVVPPFWAAALPSHGGDPSGWSSPQWTPDSAISAFMDAQQIDMGILSLTAPSVTGWKGDARRDMARRVNEYTAGLVAKRAMRFGNFATLSAAPRRRRRAPGNRARFQYIARRRRRAAEQLRGVTISGTPCSTRSGPRSPAPQPSCLSIPASPPSLSSQSSRGPSWITRSIPPVPSRAPALHGVLEKYPRVRIILVSCRRFSALRGHIGFAKLAAAVRPQGPSAGELALASFTQFYFDTALVLGLRAAAKPA